VSKWAIPSRGPKDGGYYVGGGSVCRGLPPSPIQGTWGYDYVGGCLLAPMVRLGWSRRDRYQGGTGSYRTDGKPVPNVFNWHLSSSEGSAHDH
jgi:hypothetical protein